MDFSNAFNSIDRSVMLQQVGNLAPSFAQYAFYCYAQPTPLLGDGFVIESSCGTQQGDVCGPLFFALCVHDLVKQLDSIGLRWTRWYLDDGFLAGSFKALARAMSILRSEGPRIGLFINDAKCKMFTNPSSPPTNEPSLSQVRVVEGASVLGVPLGNHTSVDAAIDKVEQSFELSLNKLCSLGQPQVATSILRSCLGAAKVTYLLRTLKWTYALRLSLSCSSSIKTTLATIIGVPLSDAQWLLASLPCRLSDWASRIRWQSQPRRQSLRSFPSCSASPQPASQRLAFPPSSLRPLAD